MWPASSHDQRRVLAAMINLVLELIGADARCSYKSAPVVANILKRIVKEQSNGKSRAGNGNDGWNGGAGY